MHNIIQLTNVKKLYETGTEQVLALSDISFKVSEGEFVAIMGPSGSGKSTLLSLLGGLNHPTEGRIVVDDIDMYSLPVEQLADFRREYLGFVFQSFQLIPYLTIIENVMLPAYPLGEPFSTLKQQALGLLEMFNLAHKAAAKVEWLSGGEAQRAAIARALVNHPEVIIADEPTAHLDTKLSREFMDIMGDFKAQGKTILIASHDPLVHESEVVDRVVRMRDGRIIDSGAI